MKVVILAGGRGTRISEETDVKPKPLVEIAGKPILWHIMKIYSHYGHNDFVICLGYKGYLIKEYFANYFLHNSDVTMDIKSNKVEIHDVHAEPWKITLVDTGNATMTGGRLKRVEKYIDKTFCFTYGDGLANININNLISFHRKNKLFGTVTGVQTPWRFGLLKINHEKVERFLEKPKSASTWINGGFGVFEPEIFKFLKNDETILEKTPLEKMAEMGQLGVYKHKDFWQPMDTLRDKIFLEDLWEQKKAPWKIW